MALIAFNAKNGLSTGPLAIVIIDPNGNVTTPAGTTFTSNGNLVLANTGALTINGNAAFTGIVGFSNTVTAQTQSVNDSSTKIATTAFVLGQVGTASPIMNSSATVGTSYLFSRQDHIHPSDTSRLSVANPSATGALLITGTTVTTSTPTINSTQTWNNGSTIFTGIKSNITNTASAINSLLLDLQVGGLSTFTVSVSGALIASTHNGLTLLSNSTGFTVSGGTTSKSLTINNNITFTGTDGSTLNIGTGGIVAISSGAQTFTGLQTFSTGITSIVASNSLGATLFSGNITSSGNPSLNLGSGAIISGAITAPTYNGISHTTNAIGFTIAGGTTSKALTINNSITFNGTDGSTLNIGTGGIVAISSGSQSFAGLQTFSAGIVSTVASNSLGATIFSGNITSSGNPSLNLGSGAVTAGAFIGSGASLTAIPNGSLVNSLITIGTTSISLGATSTALAGITTINSTIIPTLVTLAISSGVQTFTGLQTFSAGITSTGASNSLGATLFSGNITSSGAININIGSGSVTAGAFIGSGASLTAIPNGSLVNSSVTIGTTNISLGSAATALVGIATINSTAIPTSVTLAISSGAQSFTGLQTFSTGITSTVVSNNLGSTLFSGNITSSGNPSLNLGSGAVTAGAFIGSGASLTAIPNSGLNNSIVTIGTTTISLGASATALTGITTINNTAIPTSATLAVINGVQSFTGLQTFSTGIVSISASNSLGATIFSGNITSSGNPSLNLGTGTITSGVHTATNFIGSGAGLTSGSIPIASLAYNYITIGATQQALGTTVSNISGVTVNNTTIPSSATLVTTATLNNNALPASFTTLSISGNATINGSLTVSGGLTISGATTNISNIVILDVVDSIIGSITGTTVSITAGATSGIAVGQFVYGIGIASGTSVTSTAGLPTSVTVSVSQSVASTSIYFGSVAGDAAANGGGIQLLGATSKSILWSAANSGQWNSSENINLASGKSFFINGSSIISSTSLGSSVVVSSLTSVGTIGSGIWQGSLISSIYGGTGVNNGANTITAGGNIIFAGALTHAGAYATTITKTGPTNITLPTTGTLAISSGMQTFTGLQTFSTGITSTGASNSLGATIFSGNITGSISVNIGSGTVTAASFIGSGASLTSIPNSALNTSAVTIGTTSISLGASTTALTGITTINSTTIPTSATLAVSSSAQSFTGLQTFSTGITSTAASNSFGAIVLSGNITSSGTVGINIGTGTITAGLFSGSGASLTAIPNSALNTSTVTIGTTSISLGATSTALAGIVTINSTAIPTSATLAVSSGAQTFTGLQTFSTGITSTAASNSFGSIILSGNITSVVNPSINIGTGTITAGLFSGSGASLTAIPNSALTNNAVTIGTTSVSLGASATVIAGITTINNTVMPTSATLAIRNGSQSFTGLQTFSTGITSTAASNSFGAIVLSGNITSSGNPSINLGAGTVTAGSFSGSGTNLTAIPNSALTNSVVTIGTTSISLGTSTTALVGIATINSTVIPTSASLAISSGMQTFTGLQTFSTGIVSTAISNSFGATLFSGNITSSGAININIGSGSVSAGLFIGSGASLTSIPNSALINNAVTIGTTSISLGTSSTALTGITTINSTVIPTSATLLVSGGSLGTPASGILSNCNGLPISGTTGYGTGVASALAIVASGSGSIALTTSPSFTTPVLGTPTSGTLTNCTGYTYANLTGTVTTWNQSTTGQAGSVANIATFNNSGTGAVSGTTFNGSSAQVISYNTIGAQVAGTYVTPTTLGNNSLAAYVTSLQTSGNVTIGGNLTINGTTTTINSVVMNVEDINLILGNVPSPTDTTASGGGLSLLGSTTKSILWSSVNSGEWTSSESINLVSGKSFFINGISTLNSTTLGSTVLASSLTSFGVSPSFTTPVLGTPTSGTLTNCTGYTYANLTGTVPTWNQNTTGTAANATLAVTATNVAYSGLTGTAPTWNQNTTGTAASATNALSLGGSLASAFAMLVSPAFTGVPVAPTAAPGNNTTQVATTAFAVAAAAAAASASTTILTQVLAYAATVTWNSSLGVVTSLTLAGNPTIANPINLVVGTYVLTLIQDATGSRTITWGTAWKFPGGVKPVLSTAANAIDLMTFFCDGTTMYGSYLRGMA